MVNSLNKSNSLRKVIFQAILKSFLELYSLRGMGKQFHSLGTALENALIQNFLFVCFVLFFVSLVNSGDAMTRLGGGQKKTFKKVLGYYILKALRAVSIIWPYMGDRILHSMRSSAGSQYRS